MRVNVAIDLNAEKIVELADQLPPDEFRRAKRLIEQHSRIRFKDAVMKARKEFRKSGLTRKETLEALAEVRGKKRS